MSLVQSGVRPPGPTVSVSAAEPLNARDVNISAVQRSSPRESAYEYGRYEYVVLLVFCMNTSLNAYMSMETSAAEDVFAVALLGSASDDNKKQMGLFYTIFLLAVTVGITPGMIWAVRYEGVALFFSVACNVLSTWLRWLSLHWADYDLCLVSVVISAMGAWTILSMPAQISQRRFPPERRTFTTSLAVQANYFGWLLGALIPAQIEEPEALKSLCFIQAIVATPMLVLFVLIYRPPPKRKPRESRSRPFSDGESSVVPRVDSTRSANSSLPGDHDGSHSLNDGSFTELLRVSWNYPSFLLQVLASGLLGGVSFAQPSTAIYIMGQYGFKNSVSTWVNAAFIGVGVLAGLTIGQLCKSSRYFGITLKVLFMTCTASLVACGYLAHVGFVSSDNRASLLVICCFSAISGIGSIGFIGVGIQAAALYPAGPGHVCWAIEIIIQTVGGGLNFLAQSKEGFIILAATSVVATLLLLVGYRLPPQEIQNDE